MQYCGITSTVELLSLLSDVVEAMTRVLKTESTKKFTVWLADDAACLWMGIGHLTCLLTMGKKDYKCWLCMTNV